MTRIIHILAIVTPPLLIGLLGDSEEKIIKYLLLHIGIMIPISTIWRMRSYGFSFKEILTAFIPILGCDKQLEIFKREKR